MVLNENTLLLQHVSYSAPHNEHDNEDSLLKPWSGRWSRLNMLDDSEWGDGECCYGLHNCSMSSPGWLPLVAFSIANYQSLVIQNWVGLYLPPFYVPSQRFATEPASESAKLDVIFSDCPSRILRYPYRLERNKKLMRVSWNCQYRLASTRLCTRDYIRETT